MQCYVSTLPAFASSLIFIVTASLTLKKNFKTGAYTFRYIFCKPIGLLSLSSFTGIYTLLHLFVLLK